MVCFVSPFWVLMLSTVFLPPSFAQSSCLLQHLQGPYSPHPTPITTYLTQPHLWGCKCDVPSCPGDASFCPRLLPSFTLETGQCGHQLCNGCAFPGRQPGPAPCWAGAASCCSISRAAPHKIFIGSVMLFPCQTITEIGSVCVIEERILMAHFLH